MEPNNPTRLVRAYPYIDSTYPGIYPVMFQSSSSPEMSLTPIESKHLCCSLYVQLVLTLG